MNEAGTEPGSKGLPAEKSDKVDKADNGYEGHKGIRGFRSRLISLTRKEIRQLLRDRSNLIIGIGLPLVLILIFGYGLSLDVRDAKVAVVLEDPSPVAADVIAGLELSAYISPVVVTSMHDAQRLMLAREVDAIVQVQSDFSRRLAAGNAQVQLLLHGSDASRALIIRSYVSSALSQWAQRQSDRGMVAGAGVGIAAPGSVTLIQRMWFNAANTSTWYLVPGLIVLIMTLVGAFLTAMVMAREWERGTLEALFVSPVRPTEILLAKIIPYFMVGMLGLGMCLLAARFLFEVPMYGSLLIVLVSSMLYLLVALGLGLLISSVTRNQFLASQLALITSFMPALMLSGFFFDLRNVPVVIHLIGNALPATYFMELIRTLFLAGNIWLLIFKNCAILAGYAVVLLGLARAVTRKKLD
ncbi:ABC-2 type transport system permease protein [Nitrosospira sp. Nsp11]|uniref:ABC transporter permease n=1 Tax=Nitrosospira sp. Nsp11 TaxID=1855338 RepID=UPI00091CC04C|nr:ABC transporter permease [Nitrosospira sp. Nsp11]SHL37368.1 ABC-2 type transport system permease protein [Nitrosospira sp. Nsp11]